MTISPPHYLTRVERQRISLALWMALGSIFVSVLLSGGFYLSITADQRQTEKLAMENHDVLCAFQGDLAQRAAQTRGILRKYPGDPVHVFGLTLPRSQLQTNLNNQERTLNSLAGLDC